MTLITFFDGKVVMRDGKVGTGQACCCGQSKCVCPTQTTCSAAYCDLFGYDAANTFPSCDGLEDAIEWGKAQIQTSYNDAVAIAQKLSENGWCTSVGGWCSFSNYSPSIEIQKYWCLPGAGDGEDIIDMTAVYDGTFGAPPQFNLPSYMPADSEIEGVECCGWQVIWTGSQARKTCCGVTPEYDQGVTGEPIHFEPCSGGFDPGNDAPCYPFNPDDPCDCEGCRCIDSSHPNIGPFLASIIRPDCSDPACANEFP